jgi:hypothetical protein
MVDLVVTVTPSAIGGSFPGHTNLLAAERIIASAAGSFADRTVHRGRATVDFEGSNTTVNGLVLTVH